MSGCDPPAGVTDVVYRITLAAPLSDRFARGFGAAVAGPAGEGRRTLVGRTARWAGVDEVLCRLDDLGIMVVAAEARQGRAVPDTHTEGAGE